MTTAYLERNQPINGVPVPSSPPKVEDNSGRLGTSNPWPERPATAKNIVLCLDGTGKAFSDRNTNVMKIFECLVKNEPDKQVVYYQTGVGTSSEQSVFTPITTTLANWADLTIGWYLDAHVIDAYKFVQNNYTEGDRICVFGYSRGAYTARALCGFLHAIGVLPKWNTQQVDYAYQIWKSGDQLACAYYKGMMASDVDIEFLGCFDTVASVGALIPRVLPFSTHNGKTRVFRHALSLDEYRSKFRQETWHYSLPTKTFSLQDWIWDTATYPMRYIGKWMASEEEKGTEEFYQEIRKIIQAAEELSIRPVDIREVWFAGGHGDVGGGPTPDFYSFSLANITLRWMMKEACKSGSGILFDPEKIERYDFRLPNEDESWSDPDADTKFYRESREDDVKSASHISSILKWGWLEFLPVLERKQAEAGKWVLVPRINLFRPRTIPQAEGPTDPDGKEAWDKARAAGVPLPGPLFHKSVLERMQLNNVPEVEVRSWKTMFMKSSYRPYAEPPKGFEPVYVE